MKQNEQIPGEFRGHTGRDIGRKYIMQKHKRNNTWVILKQSC